MSEIVDTPIRAVDDRGLPIDRHRWSSPSLKLSPLSEVSAGGAVGLLRLAAQKRQDKSTVPHGVPEAAPYVC